MKVCVHNYYENFNINNNVFNPELYSLVDGGEKPVLALQKKLSCLGHSITTIDQYPLDDFDKFIFLDFPTNNRELLQRLNGMKRDTYLILLESDIIKPDNWDKSNYVGFKKIFGWKQIEQESKYTRLMIPQNLDQHYSTIPFTERKLACMIAGNKYNNDPRELYSERRKVIRWFETNALDDFSLYGMGWDCGETICDNWIIKRLKILQKYFVRPYPSYRGEISGKRRKLGMYKFNFCFENVSGLSGYITEKIFDALLSGVVPIYWGALDVFDFIPRETMIHFPDFRNTKELYRFISTMKEKEWSGYLQAAHDFITGSKVIPFSPEHFADTILDALINS